MTLKSLNLTITHIFSSIIRIWGSTTNLHDHYYSKLEEKILEGEQSERYRIKKSILLHHCYLIIILSFVVTVLIPEVSRTQYVGNAVTALFQILLLRSKNYALIGNCTYFHAIMNVMIQYITESNPLTIIGQILTNQHMFFLFPENNLLGKIYIPLMLFLVRDMLGRMIADLNNWKFDQIEVCLRSLNKSWPMIFLFHHYGAKNITSSYRLALIKNMEIQKELTDTLSLLKKSNKDLEGALKSRELFIASVSHELRNPLNCLIGNIELLRMDVKNKKWINTLDTCKICCEVLLGQINNVLDVAKINAEKLELHYLPINFHRLVEKAWKISAIPIKQKKIKGELRIEGNFPKYITIDSHRLTQILLNLIGNASKFTKEGFISVSITWHPTELRENLRGPSQEYKSLVNSKKRTWGTPTSNARSPKFKERFVTVQKSSFDMEDIAEKQLEFEEVLSRTISPKLMSQVMNSAFLYSTIEDVTLESKPSLLQYCSPRQKGVIKIEVVDSGCGISQEALKELFQPFKQADSSITRQFGGTGLGLYITKELIQKMGGEIFAFSTKNVGTNFCLLLPAETARKEDVKEEDHNEVSQDKPLDDLSEVRALIVDDIEDNHFILSSYLDKLGVKSDVACNGLQAVTMVKSKPPNYYTFITMDLKMPVMDGMSAMKAIRRYEQSIAVKETPIIVITANCADTEKSKCIDPKGEIRAYSFFRKPFTFDECSSIVKMIAQEKQKHKKSLKVLLVDDDAFNTSVSQEYMQRQGLQASVCSSGKEALELVKKEQFDIVLMDCEMSEMNGYVASAHIKKLKPEMLILGVTGHRREECLQKCLDSGMLDVETKPVDFKKLVNRISKLCNERSGLETS